MEDKNEEKDYQDLDNNNIINEDNDKNNKKEINKDYKKAQKENNKNEIICNSNEQKYQSDIDNISNSNSNLDDISLIGGEKQNSDKKFGSTNALSNLSSLFNNYINNYDIDKIKKKTKKKRSIYKVRKNLKNNNIINESNDNENEKENEPINLYNIIKDKLNEVKNDTLYYLEQTKQKLETKYNKYIKNINDFLFEKEKQISKLLGDYNKNDNFINYANNNLFRQLDDILEIHENIFSALEDHFNLLYSFLEQNNLIQQKKPIEYFINNNSNDILNCWFLNKINFNGIDLSNIISNKELSDLCAGYLVNLNKNTNTNTCMSIRKDKNIKLPLEIKILYNNLNKLKKIKFIGLNSDDIAIILNEINKKYKKDNLMKNSDAKKLKNLSFIDTNLMINLPKMNIPVLKKFRLKRSFISYDYLFEYIFGETNSLIQIFMENIKMTDDSLKSFFKYLSPKKSILATLKNLSFKGNYLTKIKFQNYNIEPFKNMQYLNLAKNNIYEFSQDNFIIFPELKVLDLTDNNISNNLLFTSILIGNKEKFIALLTNNIFVHNNRKNNVDYIKYISEKLKIFEHKIKRISFSLLFNKDNIEYLTKLKISPAVKISICKLDLSFCSLNNENLWKFFRNNFGLLNLEELNLSNNFFTDNVFNLCSGIQGDILLEKLYMIDLSGNQIECRNIYDLKGLDIFIDNHPELKRIKLQQTSFVNGLKKLIDGKNNKNEISNIIQRLNEKNIKFVVQNELKDYINNNEGLANLFIYKNKNY